MKTGSKTGISTPLKRSTRSQAFRQITLIRHGRPTVSLTERVAGTQLRAVIVRYDQAGIAADTWPQAEAIAQVQNAQTVFTSDLVRTLESAQKLGCSTPQPPDSAFREVDCWWDFPISWPIPAWCWIVPIRLLWPWTKMAVAETPAIAQARAARAAQKLFQHTDAGPVVLVGHGGINTLIAQELKKLGWQGPLQPSLKHWGASTYRCPR